MKKTIAFLLTFYTAFNISTAKAQPVLNQPDLARKIADRHINRDDGTTLYRRVVLMSCRFSGQKVRRCQSRPVKKEIESLSVDVGEHLEDTTILGIINAPPSEKNMAFLQKDYDRQGKPSDQWMYFPALKKLKRIVSQSDSSPKTGSLFGSEIAYEDNEKRHLSNYRYSYEGAGKTDERPCDIITAYPARFHQPRTSYSKEVFWVDRESSIALKVEFYDRQGRLNKTFYRKEIVKIKEVWIHKVLIVVNHLSGRMTMEKTIKTAVNIPVEKALIEHRALRDATFREPRMKRIRARAE